MPQPLLPGDVSLSSIAVLASGGVESCAMTGWLLEKFEQVYPVYIRFGLLWEQVERDHLEHFLSSIPSERLHRLTVLDLPVSDVYQAHWSTSGVGVPDASTPDEAVFLPGRNFLLLAKLSVWCALRGITNIALGSLASNPFPDATNEFFSLAEQTFALGLDRPIRILRPFAAMHKEEVVLLGEHLPLHLGFSCIQPVMSASGEDVHCGRCNKCHERRVGFELANIADRTIYANSSGSESQLTAAEARQ
jgi:7-cyano-7-deazaguanine synthase